MSIYIVYPEKRLVSDEEIHSMFSDAVANGAIDARKDWKCIEVSEKARLLEDVGYITVGGT